VDVVEFNHDFYNEKFRDITLPPNTKRLFSLRLCAFVDLGYEVTKANIPLSQQFAARFITIVPAGILNWIETDDPATPNVDIQTIYFEGHRIPSLLRSVEINTTHGGDVEMNDEGEEAEEKKMQF
jgi:hypothetical protein